MGPILRPDWPKKAQDELKRAIKRFTETKLCNSKNLKNHLFFNVFGVPQESLKRPKKAPKRHPKSSKASTKRDPKIDPKFNKC